MWIGYVDELDSSRAVIECIKAPDTDVGYIRYLIRVGAQVNLPYGDWTPLHLACFLGKEDVVSALFDFGADVHAVNFLNRTPLHLACAVGRSPVVQRVLQQEATLREATPDPDYVPLAARTDVLGENPLHVATREKGNMAIVRMLVQSGARLNDESGARETALNKSCSSGDLEVARYLLYRGAGMDSTRHPLIDAVGEQHLHVVQLLVDKGADVNVRRRPLSDSLEDERMATANVLRLVSTYQEDSVLHMASRRSVANIVCTLLGGGADVDATDKEGLTPLHHAASSGNAEIIGILVYAGAKVEARGEDGKTPLDLALEKRHTHLEQVLRLPPDTE